MGKKLAIWAFVLSLLFFVPLSPLVGAILGIVSLVKRDKNDPDYVTGLSIAAIIIGIFMLIVNVIIIGILAYFSAPSI